MKDNLLLKLVSLLAAVLLAYSVNSDRNTSVLSFSVPIEMKNPPDDKVLLRPTKRMAQITIRGPSFLVGPMASSPPPFRVVVPDGIGERFQASLKASELSVPSAIEVLSVEPAEMEFVFEPIERKEFKIEVPRVGQLDKQLTLAKVEVEPRVATVKGPRSELRQIKFIESDPIDLDGVSETKTMTLALRSPGSQSSLITKNVVVRVAVSEIPRQRTFERRPVEIRTSPNLSGVSITPSEVSVTIEGPVAIVSDMDPSAVIPYVRVKDAPPKEGRVVDVTIELPEGCSVAKVEPATVSVVKDNRGKGVAKNKGNKRGR